MTKTEQIIHMILVIIAGVVSLYISIESKDMNVWFAGISIFAFFIAYDMFTFIRSRK